MDEILYTKASIKPQGDSFVAVASSSVEDRHGEVVSVEGWDLKNFKKEPVILWAHDHHEPAIGNAEKVWVEGTGKRAKLMFQAKLHDYTEKARALKQMVAEGIIKSFSVGFRPLEMEGNTYLKQELLEVSLVNVPANPDAMLLAYKSLKESGFKNKTLHEVGIPVAMIEELEAVKSDVAELKESYEQVVKGLQHLNPQGRKSDVVTTRLSLLKVVARANDMLLEKGNGGDTAKLLKVIKRANEKLIVDHKQEIKLYGKN